MALPELRKRLNIVVQDASLYSGTLRDALDISGTKDDREIYEALQKVHLLPEKISQAETKSNPFANLDTFVAIGECSILELPDSGDCDAKFVTVQRVRISVKVSVSSFVSLAHSSNNQRFSSWMKVW